MSLNLNFNLPNATQVEDESEFFDTWVAPEEVKENARSYLGTDKNNLTSKKTKTSAILHYVETRFYKN